MQREEQKHVEREIKVKLTLKQPLSPFQRSYYLLYMTTAKQIKKFIKNEKRTVKV